MMIQHICILTIGFAALTGCVVGDDPDFDSPCSEDESLFEGPNSELSCELVDDDNGDFAAELRTGRSFVGYRLRRATYLKSDCAFDELDACPGIQLLWSFSHMNLEASCYVQKSRDVQRTRSGSLNVTSRWEDTNLRLCTTH